MPNTINGYYWCKNQKNAKRNFCSAVVLVNEQVPILLRLHLVSRRRREQEFYEDRNYWFTYCDWRDIIFDGNPLVCFQQGTSLISTNDFRQCQQTTTNTRQSWHYTHIPYHYPPPQHMVVGKSRDRVGLCAGWMHSRGRVTSQSLTTISPHPTTGIYKMELSYKNAKSELRLRLRVR